MKRAINFCFNLVYWIFSLLFICISYLLFFVDKNIEYMSSRENILSNIIWLIPILILTFIVIKIINSQGNNIKITFRTLIISQIILLIIQLFIAYSIYFYTGWDASTIRNTAFMMIERSKEIAEAFRLYYSYHVNQTTMAVILGLIMKLFYNFKIGNFYFGTVFISVLIVNLSGFFMTLNIYRITKNKKISLFAWIIFLMLGALSPWISIPYSDTYSMIFPILSLFLYLHQPTNISKYLNWFFIAFLSIAGMLIKPQTIILFVAIILVEMIKLFLNFRKNQIIHFVVIVLLALFASKCSDNIYKSSLNFIDFGLLNGRSFTYTHYLMTGLNPKTYGVYNDEDAALSYSTATIEEREARNWSVINDRIKTMGFVGYLDFSTHKILTNFNDGTFAWGGEGGFYVEIFDNKTPFSEVLRNFYYQSGKYVGVFFQLAQILWLWILFLLPFNLIRRDKDNFEALVIILAIIGITLFSHLFEARGRYLYSYLPFFVMGSALALHEISKIDYAMLNKNISRLLKKEGLH